ncbi:MAG: Smr/MutS family protein [bacterium]|nr:Smr/MutS family protein [bacterium]
MTNDSFKEDEHSPVEIPIDGILDLHTFDPRDAKSLVRDYLTECRARGILQVRIIHGKGTGALRETVHATLEKIQFVRSFELAGDRSGWGATIAMLSAPIREDEKSG